MKTSPCGGILGSCIGFVGRNTTAGMPPAFFAPPPHICPLQGHIAKFAVFVLTQGGPPQAGYRTVQPSARGIGRA